MTRIKEIFKTDVNRPISPVIYFHEDSPAKLAEEVGEYIITGGYDETTKDGIHEQYVKLLKGIHYELTEGGREHPACWISGFYGSGKSSFAKLLGLALDGRKLPDGKPLDEALLARDESPKQGEFRKAWQQLNSKVEGLAVVFDIGRVARDGESIHSAVRRMLAHRLGYCPHKNQAIAEYELNLEKDGLYAKFLDLYEQEFGRTWESSNERGLVADEFSLVMSRLRPDLYETALDWADTNSGSSRFVGTSVKDCVDAMVEMLKQRAPNATVFLVVDEVSQYIHGETERMLKLQTLVSELGKQLKGRVWLLATGQQKLEDDSEGSDLPKMKGRFPNHLRVHLSPANIRDVVHRRLLKKKAEREGELRSLYQQHGAKLRLNAYGGEHLTEADFLEVYPMLPGQVDLLMQISSSLKTRSSRMKGDDHGIRSLLQLLVELFREKQLGDLPLGHLVTIDHIYDVQASSLDSDVQQTMARLLSDPEIKNDEMTVRTAKAIALLQVVAEQQPTTEDLISKCLYRYLSEENPLSEVKRALAKLTDLNFIASSGKLGYKIQSSADQEWVRRREAQSVTGQTICDEVKDVVKRWLGKVNRPELKSRPFMLTAFFTDGKTHQRSRFVSSSDQSVIAFEFAFFTRKEERAETVWVNNSTEALRQESILWVNGEPGLLREAIKELIQSRKMVNHNAPRRNSLTEGERGCLNNEEHRLEQLGEKVQRLVAEVYLDGKIYFRGDAKDPHRYTGGFPKVTQSVAEEVLPQLYHHFVTLSVTDGELEQLFLPQLSSLSQTFYQDGLGILEVDSGKVKASCSGEIPRRVLEFVKEEKGVTGAELLSALGSPPYGCYPDLLKATVLGLLRGGFVKLQTSRGPISSYIDPGCKDTFKKLQEFKRAEILLADPDRISPRKRGEFVRFFEENFGVHLESEPEAIATALYQNFPAVSQELNLFFHKVNRLRPLEVKLPESLEKLPELLEKCRVDRGVDETLRRLDKHFVQFKEGLTYLKKYDKMLFEEAISTISEAQSVYQHEWLQLEAHGCDSTLAEVGARLEAHLQSEKPWDDLSALGNDLTQIRNAYREIRQTLVTHQVELFEGERRRFRHMDGFNKLTPAQQEHVLRPFFKEEIKTDAKATYPDLATLRDTPPARLERAKAEALVELDRALAEIEDAQTLPFELNLSGKVVSSEAEVEQLLGTLRERLLAQLKTNKVKVRLK